MGLTGFVLKRPVATVMALLCLLVFGISSVLNTTLEQMPDADQPMLIVVAPYPDAGPENIDELVTQPIEGQVGTIEGVKSISPTSSENRAMIILEYDYGTDMDDAYDDLSQSLDALSRQLPDDAEISVMEMNNNAGTTMMLSISNPSQEDLYSYVDQTVVPLLEQISSITGVGAMGGKSGYCKIELRSDEMAQCQATMSDVSTAMNIASPSYPSGDAVSGRLELSVSASLEHETIEALKEVPTIASSGEIVYLEDIAGVYKAEESWGGISCYNGENTVSISIIKQQSSTAMDVSSEIQEVIGSLEADDENLNIRIVRDSAGSTLSSLKDVAPTLVLTAVIPMIIIFIFFGDYKASLIVGSSIPAFILVSLILMTSAGFSLNVITISGLVLGVGMIVDNSIVVLESYFRAVEAEEDKGLLGYAKAPLSGANVVPQPVLGSTVTVCVVFLPLVFLQSMLGQIFGSMGYVIILCMYASFLSAITIVPLTYMAYEPQERMQTPMSRPMERIQNEYRRIIPELLKHKAIIMIASIIIVIATCFLASGMETELMTADDTRTVSVSIGTRPRLLSENADTMLTQAGEIVRDHPDVESYVLRYSNDSGTITVHLRDDRNMSADEIVEQWETEMTDLDNCAVTVKVSLSMSLMSRSRGYEVTLNDTDCDKLQEVSDRVVTEMTTRDDMMNAHSSIENTAPVVAVEVDPVLTATEGLMASQIGSQIRQMMDGEEVTALDMDGREVNVMAEYPGDEYRTVSQMKDIILSKPSGGYVTPTGVAEIYYEDSPASISKTDRAYEITATADYTGGNIQSTIDSRAISPSLSTTVRKGVSSMNRIIQEEFVALYQAIAIAVFLIFVVLSAQSESPKFSFMIMTAIPSSPVGSFGPLQIMRVSINMTSILGFLILVRTVVNNGILYMDTTDQYRMTMGLKTSLIEAGATCLKPITMTNLTTILSMVPMALVIRDSGSATQGLVIINIGGLSVGVAVALFVLLIYYALMNGGKRRVVPGIQRGGDGHMRYGKIGAGCLAATLYLDTMPAPAWVGTPEFAYTAEQWTFLKDNQLDFAEIADLIHVYNNAAIQNQLEYEDLRGEDVDNIADDYYDTADDVYGSLECPDSSDSDYASRLSSYLSSQTQTDDLREQGNDNVEDGDIKKLECDKTEAGLVKEAQELMVSYWSQTYSLESLEQNKIQAQSSYDQTLTRLGAGMSTQAQVLSARGAVTSADVSLLSARSSLGQTKGNLCLMLGWTYGAQVGIGDVPEPDLEGMTTINPGEDVSGGVEDNYSLKILEEKIANAKNGINKSSLKQSLESQKETAAFSIKNAYKSMMISKSDHEQALNAYEIEVATMEAAKREMTAEIMTRNNYITQQSSFATAQVNVHTQRLAFLRAQLEYQQSVDRLTSVLQDGRDLEMAERYLKYRKKTGWNRGETMRNRSHVKGSSRRRGNRKRTVMVLLIMVLCLSGTGVRTSYASQEASRATVPGVSQDVSPEATGNMTGTIIIEYGNLRELLKQGNLSLRKSIENYENSINACQEIWDTLKWEQNNMEDKTEEMSGEDSQTARIYSSSTAMLKFSVSRIYSQLDTMTSEKGTRSLEKSADTFTITAQTLMGSYNRMVQNVKYQEKRIESLQAAFGAMVRKQAADTAIQAQLREAKKSLDTTGNSLESLRLQAGELRHRLLTMSGIKDNSQVVIEAIPEPDMAVIGAVDYESDKDRAMGNDKNVQNAHHTPASSTTEISIKFKLTDEAEGTKEAAFLASYQNLQASKAAYEAALTAFQSARLTYEGLRREQQVGLLTNAGYLEGRAAYLEKKTARGTASVNLATAYESYYWGVKGASRT